ncbi:MAG: FKBP-type peptidyl-prolyl cis-trans isomerase [Brumimicrobium sp.]|nr:FKBP-type peptidyl-prolyl cis-trans isomerase [Brumimicrobium sp.]
MRYLFVLLTLVLLESCEVEGVRETTDNTADSLLNVSKEAKDNVLPQKDTSLIEEKEIEALTLDNGIKITWYKKGKGRPVKKNDLIKIDYRNKLEDGTVYDGNHLIRRPYIPFFVGWNQQTPGWDLALNHLRVGDDVDIFIPANLARGEKGIKGLVPPNANNILSMRVLEIMEPTKVVDGIKIWKVAERKNPGDSVDFKDKVFIDYWVSSESMPRYDNSYQRNQPFELVMGDGNIVPGLYKALHFAREGDKLMIHIPSAEAYGKKGLPSKVKPGEDILYDLLVTKVIKNE